MTTIKTLIRFFTYPFIRLYFCIFPIKIEVETIYETINKLIDTNKSLIRFGDGEIKIINGGNLYFQTWNSSLAYKLNKILREENENLLIGLNDIFGSLEQYTLETKLFFNFHLFLRKKFYKTLPNRLYSNAMISRAYFTFKNNIGIEYFNVMKTLWNDTDITFIEGENTRNGVGNDLYSNAKSIQRILCPSKDAFKTYDEILDCAIKNISKKSLILVSLGPTGKILAYELFIKGYRIIDIGHLDNEYEWCMKKAKNKVKILGKHTAENFDENISVCNDEKYHSQIIAKIVG